MEMNVSCYCGFFVVFSVLESELKTLFKDKKLEMGTSYLYMNMKPTGTGGQPD